MVEGASGMHRELPGPPVPVGRWCLDRWYGNRTAHALRHAKECLHARAQRFYLKGFSAFAPGVEWLPHGIGALRERRVAARDVGT